MVRRRAPFWMLPLAAISLLLSACAGSAGPTASPSVSPSPSSSASPLPSPSPAPAISILSPPEGATVSSPVSASGTANTFEAALTVDALNEAGDVLCIRQVMATSGSGTPGTWDTQLGFAPESASDTAPITLRAYAISADDGSMIDLVERSLTLSPELPPIVLTSPVCGDTVAPGGNLAIQGTALVFEAALTVELRDAAGDVRFTRNLMTEDGSRRSNFGEIATLPADLSPGFYDLVAFNISAKDGSVENEFPVQISVQ